MYKGYRNRTNKGIDKLNHINKCLKCHKFNPSLQSPALNNIQLCMYCGNPFYIIKPTTS